MGIKRRKTEGKKAKFNLPSELSPTLTTVKLLCLLRQDVRKKNCPQSDDSVGTAVKRGSSAALVHLCKTLQNCGLTGQQPPGRGADEDQARRETKVKDHLS